MADKYSSVLGSVFGSTSTNLTPESVGDAGPETHSGKHEHLVFTSAKPETSSARQNPVGDTPRHVDDKVALSESHPGLLLDDDSWLDSWDVKIHRCPSCSLPFGTDQRLKAHFSAWHTPTSTNIPVYLAPEASPFITESIEDVSSQGDLIITAGSRNFRVASQVLWTVSPVFAKMFGPEAWGKEALEVKRANLMGRPAHLHLEDDDPRILKILLDLLHLRSIPKLSDMTWEDLVQMAVLTDKYELRHTILQFVDYWTEPFGGTFRSTDNGAKKTELHKLGGWLLLSWTFGFPKIFEEVCQEIVVSCEKPISGVAALLMVEEDDDTGRKHEVNRYCMPQSLFDKLIGLREARIEKIRMHIQTLRDQLEPVKDHQPFCKKLADPHGWGDHSTYCKEKGGPEKCDLWQFAHLAKMNYAHDLSDEKTYDHSIRWFLRLAEKMRSSNYSTCSWVPALKQLCEEMATDKAGLKLSDYK